MRKKLLLTVAVLSVLGIHSSAQALSFEDAKAIFDTPVVSNEPETEPVPVDDSATLPGESEPNNAAASADPIASGVQFTGQLFSGADQDWFRFETTQNNEIVTIETSEANSSWTLTLVDRAGNTIASAVNATSVGERLGTDDPAFRLSVTAERAGTYYLLVRPAPDTVAADGSPITDTFVDAAYRITVTLSDPTNPDNPVLDSNFNDLETEPNNRFQEADPLASGKILLGQLLDGGDEDWFEIQSPGNEIIDIDFCGSGSPCEGQDNRIVMVLKKEFIDTAVEQALESPALVYASGLPGPAGTLPPYIEYLGEQGLLGNALVGKLHPDFGQANQLQIGIDQPGTYYFVVAGKLARNENGSIDTHVTIGSTQNNCSVDNGDNVQSFETAIGTAIDEAVKAEIAIDSLIDSPEALSPEALLLAREARTAASKARTAADLASLAASSGNFNLAATKAAEAADEAENTLLKIIELTVLEGFSNAANDARTAARAAQGAARDAEEAAKEAVTTESVNLSPCEPETIFVTEGPFVVFEAFNDDQYSIRIRRTSLAPHTPGTDAFVAERARASFDSSTNIIHIPELEFNGAVFEAELIHRNEDERNIYELLQLRELDQ